MKKTEKYILFLNNRYSAKDNSYYLKNLKGKTTVAIDGGIRFFIKNKIRPDILIGDFDSAPKLSNKYLKNIEVIRHSAKKDKTDSQLAVELALDRGANNIEICGALSNSEIDHTLGNIFLLELVNKFKSKRKKNQPDLSATIIDAAKKIFLIKNESVEIKGKPGDFISIIPLEDSCFVDFGGLAYPPPPSSRKLLVGDSLTLRNRFKNKRARIEVSGKFIIVAYSED